MKKKIIQNYLYKLYKLYMNAYNKYAYNLYMLIIWMDIFLDATCPFYTFLSIFDILEYLYDKSN